MQPLVFLLHLLLPNASPHPAILSRLVEHSLAPRGETTIQFGILLLSPVNLSTRRISDALIGVSCIAIAVTLGWFISGSGRDLKFRRSLIAFASCAAFAGVCALLAAAVARSFHPRIFAQTSLAVALLAVVSAVLLPFILPHLLDKSREITEAALTAATATAQKFESRFLAAATSTSDALYLLEPLRAPDGHIEDFLFTYLNATAEKIIGRPGSEVLGARVTRILPLKSSGKLFQQYCEVVRTGKPLIHEFPLIANDPHGPWMRHQVTKIPAAPSASGDQDTGLAVMASDITERKHAQYNLNGPNQQDALTGLPTRHLIDDRIGQAIARAQRYKSKVGIFILNIDGMQQINSRYGRAGGDQVLRTTANRLRTAIRATDSVIRLDSDEFIIVLPEMMQITDLRRTAATLLAAVRRPINLEGSPNPTDGIATVNGAVGSKTAQISASLGAAFYPDFAANVSDLLTAADIAMCRAKMQGKNQYVLFDPDSDPQMFGEPGLAPRATRAAEVDFESEQYAD